MPEDTHAPGYTTIEEDLEPRALATSITSAVCWPRESLFIHAFDYMVCCLGSALFSRCPNRHAKADTACPEYLRVTQKARWMATVNDSPGEVRLSLPGLTSTLPYRSQCKRDDNVGHTISPALCRPPLSRPDSTIRF